MNRNMNNMINTYQDILTFIVFLFGFSMGIGNYAVKLDLNTYQDVQTFIVFLLGFNMDIGN